MDANSCDARSNGVNPLFLRALNKARRGVVAVDRGESAAKCRLLRDGGVRGGIGARGAACVRGGGGGVSGGGEGVRGSDDAINIGVLALVAWADTLVSYCWGRLCMPDDPGVATAN